MHLLPKRYYVVLSFIVRIGLVFLKKCWISCGTVAFVIFVIYWYFSSWIALCLFIFSITGVIYQLGDCLLYHPDQPPNSRIYVPLPSMFGMDFDNLRIKTADGLTLHAVMVKQEPSIISHVPTILYFHGNAGNIGHRLPNVRGLHQLCHCNVLLVEYRGYGHSNGTPSEEGLYLDAQAALDFLLQHPVIDHTKIIVFGRSLGGAVAIDLASHSKYSRHIMMLIVENTFTNIPETAKALFAWKILRIFPMWFYKNQFSSIDKIQNISIPILFISGLADVIIPPAMMQELYKVSSSTIKRLVTFASGTHNETWQCCGYYKAINLFINDVLMAYHKNHKAAMLPSQEACITVPADII